MFSMVAWCLWIRRMTWKSDWERSATICVAQSAFGALLLTPTSAKTLGVWLYHVAGQNNIQDLIGLSNETGAASALYVNVLIRVAYYSGKHVDHLIRYRIQLPLTIAIPVMSAVFLESPRADQFYSNFLDAPMDSWLVGFWVIFCGTMIYLMYSAAQCLLVLRHVDPDSRRIANMYLVSIAFGVAGCVLRITTALFDDGDDHNWILLAISSALMYCIFTFACTWSWRSKIRSMNQPSLRP